MPPVIGCQSVHDPPDWPPSTERVVTRYGFGEVAYVLPGRGSTETEAVRQLIG